LHARVDLLRTRVRHAPGIVAEPVTVTRSIAAFIRGLVFGARSSPDTNKGTPR
jgi:hypothetical protein